MYWAGMPVPTRDRIISDSGESGSAPQILENLSPPSILYNSPYSYQRARIYRRIWDVETPGWKGKINQGEIICSNFLDYSFKASHSPILFSCEGTYSGTPRRWTGLGSQWSTIQQNLGVTMGTDFPSCLAAAVPDEDSLRAEAVTSSFARVDVSELEMLASLGEMPETVEWFRDVLKRLIAIVAAFKKREYSKLVERSKLALVRALKQKKNAAKKAGAFSEDAWMELRYAIRPLVFEVQAYLAALDTRVERAVRKTARKSTFSTSTNSRTHSNLPYGPILPVTTHWDSTTSRSIRAGVLYDLQLDKMGWWTHLGLDAPVSAYWAVTRLSFVFDWFFNIGQWIASWEPRLGLSPLANWVVETRTTETITSYSPGTVTSTTWPGYIVTGQSVTDAGDGFCEVQTKTRWANPDRQVLPTFSYRGLKVAQVADLVIIGRKLTSQLFR